jgi:transposase InsO family protein
LEKGEAVSRKRVSRLMQEDDLVARRRRRFKCTTMSDHHHPVAANVLDRQFRAEAQHTVNVALCHVGTTTARADSFADRQRRHITVGPQYVWRTGDT